MRTRGGLLSLGLIFSLGCSFVLDPEECTSSTDCENGQSCRSGICLGPVIPLTPADVGPTDIGVDAEPPDVGGPLVDAAVDMAVPADQGDAERPPARPPICDILDPAMADVGPLSAERITIRGVIGDPDTQVTDLQATLAGMPLTLDAQGGFTLEVVLAEGPNTIVLSATDDAGLTCRDQVVVRVDRTAPVINILDPNGDVVVNPSRNPYRISGTLVEEGGVASIEVTVNGAAVAGPALGAGAFGFPITLAAGPNTVEMVAQDRAGNRSAPVVRTLTLDDEAPVVTITSPDPGTRTATDRIRVQGHVTTDGAGERRSNMRVLVGGRPLMLDPADRVANDDGAFDLGVALTVGDNRLTIEGDDQAGNRGTAELLVIREDPAPCVAIEAPVNLAFVGLANVAVEGTVCPAVTEVELQVDNGMVVAGVVDAGRFSGQVTLPAGRRSTINVRALTADAQAAQASVQAFFDATAPTVSINVPAAGSCQNAARIRVCGQVDDPESGVASVTANGTAADVLAQDYCADLALPEGANQPIRIVAENGAGLRTRLPVLGQPDHLINVDRTPPTISLDNGDEVPWLRPDAVGEIVLRGRVDGGTCAALSARVERLCAGDDPVDAACVAQPQEVGLQGDGSFTFRRVFPDGRQRGVLIRVTDTAGNQAERRYAFRVDGVAPTVVNLTEGGSTREAAVQICLTARDPASGVQQIRIGGQVVALVPQGADQRGCRDVPLAEGENTIAVDASDLVGNLLTAQVRFNRDTTAPQVAITWPVENGDVGTPTQVEGTINDGPVGSGPGAVRVNGVAAVVDAAAGTWRASRVPVDPDDPALVVDASDRNGNQIQPLRRVVQVPDYIDIGARNGLTLAREINWLGITDTNRDGLQDIIAFTGNAAGISAVHTQQADRTFVARGAAAAGLPDRIAIRAAALGDLDADGAIDIMLSAVASTGAYLGLGNGNFRLVNSGVPINVAADGLALGDLNRDGTLDLLLLAGAATRVQTNIGGTFNTQPLADFGLAAVVDGRVGTFADVTGDQVLDLITVGPAGSRLLRGTLAGPFQAVAFESLPADRITLVDADRSGTLDPFTSTAGAARFYVNEAGGFTSDTLGIDWQAGDRGLQAADLDGDARDDVVVFGDNGLRTYQGVDGGFVEADFGLPVVAGVLQALAIADLDGDGDLDLVYGGPAGVGLISSNLAVLRPDRLYSRVAINRGVDGAAGPVDAVGAVIAHEYAAGLQRLVPALPGAPTLISLTGDDIEVQVRFIDLGDPGGASRSLPALVAEPGVIHGPE